MPIDGPVRRGPQQAERGAGSPCPGARLPRRVLLPPALVDEPGEVVDRSPASRLPRPAMLASSHRRASGDGHAALTIVADSVSVLRRTSTFAVSIA